MNMLFAVDLEHISRREFFEHARNGMLGLLWFGLLNEQQFVQKRKPDLLREDPPIQPAAACLKMGRVLEDTVAVYKQPYFDAELVNMYWRDLVYPINSIVLGDKQPEHNRLWFRMNDEGYVHSGKVQPVAVNPVTPLDSVPEKGVLGELCVPFTDARWDPERPDLFATRLYFHTTYWIIDIKVDSQGKKWYLVPDDKKKKFYYVNAEHLRPMSAKELAPLSPQVPDKEKRIEVRLGEQFVIAYEHDQPVFMTRTSTGGIFIDGNYTTPTGQFMTNRKRPSRHMASGDLAAPNAYDLPGVPWVCYLTLKGVSFHGTYWHNDFGRPRSHGCLNLPSEAAKWIYRWTLPAVPLTERILEKWEGTRVDVLA
jgi:hypothetical protein